MGLVYLPAKSRVGSDEISFWGRLGLLSGVNSLLVSGRGTPFQLLKFTFIFWRRVFWEVGMRVYFKRPEELQDESILKRNGRLVGGELFSKEKI